MKKIVLFILSLSVLACCLALCVLATDRQTVTFKDADGVVRNVDVVKFKNDTAENVASVLGNNAKQQALFKDDGAYAVLKASDGTLTAYPTWYVIEPSGDSPSYVAISEVEYTYINKMEKEKNGDSAKSYGFGAIVYIEFPEGMTHIRNNGVFGRGTHYEKNVVEIVIPSTVTEVQDMAFSQNKTLKRVIIANNNGITRIGDDAFLDCSSLEYFEFEKLDKLTFIDGFNNCALLTGTLDLSNSALTEIGNNAFNSCKFSTVLLPDTVKKLGTGVFKNNGLTSFKFPRDLEYIGDETFYNNPNMVLESGILPSGLKYVGINFLGYCKVLPETIVFPEGVTTIPDEGFPEVSRPNGEGVLNIVFLGKMTKVIIDGGPYQNWAQQVNVYFAQNTISDFNGKVYSYTDKQSGALGSYTSQNGTLVLDISDRSISSTSKVGDNFIQLVFCGKNGAVEQSYVLTTNGDSITEDRGLFDMASHSHMAFNKIAGDCTSDKTCIVCDVNFAEASHAFEEVMSYANGFMTNGIKSEKCQNPDCRVANDGIILEPIFVSVGVSISEMPDAQGKYSAVQGYSINKTAYEAYVNGGYTLTYGFVTSIKSVTGDTPLAVENGVAVAINPEKTIVVSQNIAIHSYVDLKVMGLSSTHNGEEIIMCLFVFDGVRINYIGNGVQSGTAITYMIDLPQ